MVAVNPTCYHMSASSIAAFKACPQRFRLQYREGLRKVEDTDSQRVGTNWHALHEHYADAMNEWVQPEFSQTSYPDGQEAYALQAVVAVLNERYEKIPSYKTPEEFALERQVLLTSFLGYLWFYQNDPIEFLANELAFNLPLHLPRTGMPLPLGEVQRVGKIDHVIRWQGGVGALERKSTSRAIGADSDYWQKAQKDTQVSMYALAFKDLMASDMTLAGLVAVNERFGNTLYDVWHKPTIKPAMLTQAKTLELISSGGPATYCDQEFQVEYQAAEVSKTGETWVTVDGEPAVIEQGKKGFAIRETVAMFGARLLADIYERPDFYYVRREIARTDAELRQFRQQLFAVYTAQKAFEKNGMWYENESQCRATFTCPYVPVCYGAGADAVCDGKTTPPGFRRIFVDLTVNGESIEE